MSFAWIRLFTRKLFGQLCARSASRLIFAALGCLKRTLSVNLETGSRYTGSRYQIASHANFVTGLTRSDMPLAVALHSSRIAVIPAAHAAAAAPSVSRSSSTLHSASNFAAVDLQSALVACLRMAGSAARHI